jgi:Iap family predicted aminopeptidase
LEECEGRLETQLVKGVKLETDVHKLTEALNSYQVAMKASEKQTHRHLDSLDAQLTAKNSDFEGVSLDLEQAIYEKQMLYDELQRSQSVVYSLESKLSHVSALFEARMKDIDNVRPSQLSSTQDVECRRKNAELTQQLKLANFEQEKQHQARLIFQLNSQVEDLKLKVKTAESKKENLKMLK